jgi:2-polyprenyl-3-methyl-5-hydroxy-6-metoxy-1,4-benzoquinol methylase
LPVALAGAVTLELEQRRRKFHMISSDDSLAEAQRTHWQATYATHPHMYGDQPSLPARYAAGLLTARKAKDVLELGTGHGRDSLFFARQGFTVQATDLRRTPACGSWQ